MEPPPPHQPEPPLSLVFICREDPRRSGILLFPDRPRVCRLMKTWNCNYLRSSGMNGDKSEESGALFCIFRMCPRFLQWLVIIRDKWKLKFVAPGTSALVSGGFCSLPIPLSPVPLSQLINMASLSTSDIIGKIRVRPLANIGYISKIWDGCQKVKSLIFWDFPDIWNQENDELLVSRF